MAGFGDLDKETQRSLEALSTRLIASWARHAPVDALVDGLSLVPSRRQRASFLYESSACILAHDGAGDPRFTYANEGAQRLFGYALDAFIGMPSRLSARPAQRDERAAMLNAALKDGFYRGYRGVRVRADGSLFVMEDATIWTVFDEDGRSIGQAARFVRTHEFGA